MTSVFEVFAKLGLDSSEFDSGLDKAKGALSTAMDIGIKAVAGATAAVGAFATSSVKTGMGFDSSMSQVAATMGKSMDEMANEVGTATVSVNGQLQKFSGNLRDYAQFMGANTAFSAKQAADALNYMALAGYDVQTSMGMLPNVLNLAAAGSIDLASASDMVTDAQSALGLSLDETSTMVDQMAKASSKSNTSVAQLGEAFLTIGATARNLAGGTTELSTVLGVLADNGIKGAEGGTHLRNMLLALQTPTKDGTAALAQLGLTYDDMYDSAGNMRSLPDIMVQLQHGMEGMTQASKDAIISGIFNKTDLAAANALIGTSKERFDELTESIDNADGAAQEMADTQLDNLAGDVTLFKSALEGVQIALSDLLTPALRTFVEDATTGLSGITTALTNGDWSGAIDAVSQFLTSVLMRIVDGLPEFINMGMQLVGSIGQGILTNLPTVLDMASQVITMFAQGIVDAVPSLLDGAIQIIEYLGTFILDNVPSLLDSAVAVVVKFADMLSKNADKVIDGAITLLETLETAIYKNIPVLLPAILKLVLSIGAAIVKNIPHLLKSLVAVNIELIKAIVATIPEYVNTIKEFFPPIISAITNFGSNVINSVKTFFVNLITNIGESLAQIPTIVSQLFTNTITSVKSFFTSMLSTAKDNFLKLVDSANKGMGDMLHKVVDWLSQLPGKMAYWIGYAVGSFIKGVNELPGKVMSVLTTVLSKFSDFARSFAQKASDAGRNFLNSLVDAIRNLPSTVSGIFNDAVKSATSFAKSFIDAIKNLPSNIKSTFDDAVRTVSTFARDIADGAKKAGGDFVTNLINEVKSLPSEFMEIGKNIVKGLWDGINGGWDWLKKQVKKLADDLVQGVKDGLKIKSPSRVFMGIGKMVDEGFAKGIIDNENRVMSAMQDLISIPSMDEFGTQTGGAGISAVNAGSTSGYTQIINITSPTALTPYEVARQTRNATRDMFLSMRV